MDGEVIHEEIDPSDQKSTRLPRRIGAGVLTLGLLAGGAATCGDEVESSKSTNTTSTIEAPLLEESLKSPFDKPVFLLTIDRFSSTKDGSDLGPATSEFLSSVESDNLMVRVVLDPAMDDYPEADVVNDYEDSINTWIRPHSETVMLGMLDSQDFPSYSQGGYEHRARLFAEKFGQDEDVVFEIGNEINGDWLGEPEEVVQKISSMHQIIREQNSEAKIALTLYYDENTLSWLDSNFDSEDTARLRETLDFLTISYYPEDVGISLDANSTDELVTELADRFPSAAIGFGEIGFSEPENFTDEEFSVRLAELYGDSPTLTSSHPRYVLGGGIWNVGYAIQEEKTEMLDNIRNSS